MMTISIHLTPKFNAECVASSNGAWLTLDDDSLNDFSLFLPRGVPAEKVQTIADAINDALDTVRAQQSEAA